MIPNLLDNFNDYERIIEEHEKGDNFSLDINLSPTCLLALIQYYQGKNRMQTDFYELTGNNLFDIGNNNEDLKDELYSHLDSDFGGEFLLRFIINEITNNIEEHSYCKNSYFLSKEYEDKLELSFYDDGISIPQSLNMAGIDIENDCDAIDKAVNGVSEDKTNELLRGYGHNSSANLIVKGNRGSILIASREGLLHIDNHDKKFKELKNNYIQGTLISALINKSIVTDFYQYMEHMKI